MIPFTQDVFLIRGKTSILPLYRLHINSHLGGLDLKKAYATPKYWGGMSVGPVCHDEDGYSSIVYIIRLNLIQSDRYTDYPF